ncbi:phytoene desaturase family protein [Candidatus Uabimicrobium sp. HlEnr_7]|uniref:phytoene desaturase family protein n=1 Tax=Candidatus Uabimicrobium helgolandensis TaxID=3095367 RepID=UPI003556AC33
MKKTYWGKKSSDNKSWDYIVIGSGIGGMATASLLGSFGKKVLILERHYQPGGFTHTFSRKGYTWDVGVHTMGQVTLNHLEGRILQTLCGDNLQWKSMGNVCEIYYYPDKTVEIKDSVQAQMETLTTLFPEDEKAIKQYFKTVEKALRRLEFYYTSRCLFPHQLSFLDRIVGRNVWKWFGKTTEMVMKPMFKNKQLYDILTTRWVYYGAPPSTSSFGVQAIVDRHFHQGGYYPCGGGKQFVNAFLKKIYEQEGWTRINAEVTQINTHKNRVTGVTLNNGEKINAPRVVSAIPVHCLEKILPQPSQPWLQELQQLPSTPAHLCLHLGFNSDIRNAGATAANAWILSDYGAKHAIWDITKNQTPGILYCSFPSLKDKHTSKHTAEIITFAPWDLFDKWQNTKWKKRGEEYELFKSKLTEQILQQFFTVFPNLKTSISYSELSTPLTTNHFMGTSHGSIYGLAPTPERYHSKWVRPRTPINGLFLSGSDMASPGVIGAMMGGVLSGVACCPVSGTMFLLKHMFR